MLIQELEIEEIAIDPAMQQRGISDDTVALYAEAMQAGDVFPAIELVFDGENYFVFDGFHRVKAAQKVGLKTISANIRQGSRRDAEYLSFSSNARHGLPRPRGSLKRILKKILVDPEWSKEPLRQIAKHVGCDPKYVRMTRNELLEVGDCPQPLQRAERITVKTRDGQEYERPSERKDRPAKTVSDLTRIITQLAEIDTNKAAEKKLSAAIKNLESAKSLVRSVKK